MKTKMYSIYDKVAAVFNKPFTDLNDASATRAFHQSLNEQPHALDYELYRIGEYDDSNGQITPLSPERISSGFDFKAQQEETVLEAV